MSTMASHYGAAPKLRRLLIFGAGGHGREIAWLAEQCLGNEIEIIHLVDHTDYLQASANGRSVVLLKDCEVYRGSSYVAAVGDSKLRERAAQQCDAVGLVATTLFHPRNETSQWIEFGPGSVACANSVLTTNIAIGQHVHVNIGCTISHDVTIGDFSTLSPGVHVSGHVQIGRHVFVGTGANIINGNRENPLVIGDEVVVAAGACVTGSVAAGSIVAGVPATRRR